MYSVFGLGNPLLDFIAPIEPFTLESLEAKKGTMNLVDRGGLERVLSKLDGFTNIPGGSAANTLRAISWLDQARQLDPLLYCGAVGPDSRGRDYNRILETAGIDVQVTTKTLPTGCSVILVTPDHERTMFTYLGACREYGLTDLNLKALEAAKIFYTTGYMWDTDNQKQAVLAAAEHSRNRGVQVYFDLADPFVVQRYHEEFLSWLPSRVDVLFGNRDEFQIMFGPGLSDRELLAEGVKVSPVVLMKTGCDGCFLNDHGTIHQVEGFCVEPLDTTAAGDCFSAAFIFATLRGHFPARAAKLANRLAAAIVTVLGCDFSNLDRDLILREGLS
ncbi:MAG: adenosine kinase [Spirochaetaceae bacterium]|nr:MAG: adenosine kinase [Spirochaetaceae bacterium]